MISNTIISFLQLWLATLAFAAPIADDAVSATSAKPWHYGTGGGIIGFIILILDIIVWSTSPLFASHHLPLTLRSRGPPVEPASGTQAAVVPRRLHLPPRRHGHLLALLEPQGAHEGLRVRAAVVETCSSTIMTRTRDDSWDDEIAHGMTGRLW
ncbi:Cardiolipin synthase [Fusarium albosuccineum]|uniref:Cardiolipin synthase n=1 Tax=Fusarium albosuccineum TaxID=1237068 RepID=A0A8H4LDA5_9HYPO|nr:Cardiolipin synthase [Fusarium albosuccineum]